LNRNKIIVKIIGRRMRICS